MKRRDEGGAVMIEFALVLPILLTLLVGIVQFGQAYNVQISVQAAAREGVRAVALSKSPPALGSGMAGSTGASCTPGVDGTASYTVSKDFVFSIPFVTLGTKTLTATGTMRCGA